MVILRCKHAFQGSSGLPEDRFVNTFFFQTLAVPTETDLTNLTTAIFAFYDQPAGSTTQPLTYYYSPSIDTAGRTIKVYNEADTIPRAPLFERTHGTWTVPSGTGALPYEVAVCMSYSAEPVSGIPAARRRGRLYLGPLNQNAVQFPGGSTEPSRPDSGFQLGICNAAQALKSLAFSTASANWVLHSPASGFDPLIVKVWVDDAWDTQRRRGLKATSRMAVDLV